MSRERKIDMVILGLLSHETLTGYDIKKRIDGAISFFWKGSFGNIYPALQDLEKQGSIIKKDASTGGRPKNTYQITNKGIKILTAWIEDEAASNDLRYESLLKLFFGGSGSKEVSVRNIELFEKKIQKDLRLLKSYCDVLKDEPDNKDHLHYYLTASFGVDTYEAYLKWCSKAKRMLKKGTL